MKPPFQPGDIVEGIPGTDTVRYINESHRYPNNCATVKECCTYDSYYKCYKVRTHEGTGWMQSGELQLLDMEPED